MQAMGEMVMVMVTVLSAVSLARPGNLAPE